MGNYQNTKPDTDSGITILDAQTSAAFPPTVPGTDSGDVSGWTVSEAVGVFDLEISAAGTVDLTDARLFGKVGTVWYDYGLLGAAGDGAISLLATKGYTTRVNHRSRTTEYALAATFSDTIAVSAVVHIVQGL